MAIDNCKKCGKIFNKTIRDICETCIKEEHKLYDKCYNYLRENKDCNLETLSKETGVSVDLILKFIREGRISIGNSNFGYPCRVCGTSIKKDSLCDFCQKEINQQLNKQPTKIFNKNSGYHSIDKKNR